MIRQCKNSSKFVLESAAKNAWIAMHSILSQQRSYQIEMKSHCKLQHSSLDSFLHQSKDWLCADGWKIFVIDVIMGTLQIDTHYLDINSVTNSKRL